MAPVCLLLAFFEVLRMRLGASPARDPSMNFVAIKTPEQMDLLALHRVRSRLVGQRTGAMALRSARQRQRRAAIDCIEAEYLRLAKRRITHQVVLDLHDCRRRNNASSEASWSSEDVVLAWVASGAASTGFATAPAECVLAVGTATERAKSAASRRRPRGPLPAPSRLVRSSSSWCWSSAAVRCCGAGPSQNGPIELPKNLPPA